jgi:hypothetical protein
MGLINTGCGIPADKVPIERLGDIPIGTTALRYSQYSTARIIRRDNVQPDTNFYEEARADGRWPSLF